ncbi:MAG: NDP-sugar synthase [Candidatus Peribacteraceae bacterium]
MKAFILAGGFATRLWPLTEKRAKPLLPVAGKPLVSYLAHQIPKDIPITLSTNAAFADDFGAWKKTVGRDVEILIEDAGHDSQKLGALGAVRAWILNQKIDDDILLLAGDNFVGCPMSQFLSAYKGRTLIAGYDIGSIEAASSFGTVVMNGDGTVQSFEEKPMNPRSTIISTGWSILPRATLPILTDYAKTHPDNIGGIFEELLRQNTTIDCFTFTELWKDIGSFEAYLDLHRSLVGEKVLKAPGVQIEGTECHGSVDLGAGTTVTNSILSDCIVFGDTTINNCVLRECIVDTGCTLEGIDLEGKMLRAGTVLRK